MIEAVLLEIIYLLLFALVVETINYSICLNYIYSIFKQIDNKKHICNLPV